MNYQSTFKYCNLSEKRHRMLFFGVFFVMIIKSYLFSSIFSNAVSGKPFEENSLANCTIFSLNANLGDLTLD